MELYTINYIKTNPLIYNYLRENSRWYKELTRDKNILKYLEEQAKKYYRQTPIDKIEQLSNNINMITSLIDVFK